MNRLDIAKRIIEENVADAVFGIFDCRNSAGDDMYVLYSDNLIRIEICYPYGYFEVFGLTYTEFEELKEYYLEIRKEYR